MQLGVDATSSHAYGSYVASQRGFSDKSAGSFQVLQVNTPEELYDASYQVMASHQFVRYGPMSAARMGRNPEQPLVKVLTLSTLNAREQHFKLFSIIP
jgi:hypothetical protein